MLPPFPGMNRYLRGNSRMNRSFFAPAILLLVAALGSPLFVATTDLFSSAVAQTQEDADAQAKQLFQQGAQLFRNNQFAESIPVMEQALQLYRQLGNRQQESLILKVLIISSDVVQDATRRLKYRQQQLDIARLNSDRQLEAELLVDLAEFAKNYVQQLDLINQSIVIAQEIKSLNLLASGLRARASIYYGLGNFSKAIEYTQQSQAIAQTLDDPVVQMGNLVQLGQIYLYGLAEFERSIQYFDQSLTLAKSHSNYRPFQARALSGLGAAYLAQGDYAKAIQSFEQVGEINQVLRKRYNAPLDQAIEAQRLGLLAEAYAGAGDQPKALALARQSVALLEGNPYSDQVNLASAIANLGYVLYVTGDLMGAEAALRRGIQGLNTIRSNLGAEDDHKVSYADVFVSPFYEMLQQVLIAQNQPAKALEVAEEARARAFVELLATRQALTNVTQAEATRISAPDLNQIQQIAKQQNATLVVYSLLYDGQQGRLPARLQGRQPHQQSDLLIWVVQPNGNIGFRRVKLSDVRQPKAVVLRMLIDESRTAIGARSRSDVAPQLSPAALAQLQAQQNTYLRQLHQLLIEPIADLLPNNPEQRVIFMPQGELFLVPFPALLNAQNQPLITQHTILTAPSIQTLDLTHKTAQTRPRGDRPALVVGNPTMPAVSTVIGDSPQKLSPLPGAETEAQAIARQLNTQAIIGASARKDVVQQKMQQAGIIHLATHGLLDSFKGDTPGAIALAPIGTGERNDGLLTSGEIFDLKLNADLVVLSACDTGRGDITGDGVIGLSRSLFVAGVPSVIVSLWKVPDDSTALLMTEFYKNWKDRKLDKAQALRQAMLTTMKTNPNPKDWAAFTLIGEAE